MGRCEDEYDGKFLKLVDIPNWLRLILSLIGLFWVFLGIAVISDIFMAGIEKVTSKKKRVLNKETGKMITVEVWNATIANLTLMALGSSAPEILLSLIEILLGNFLLGDLGAGTIVGSAAFNLLMISAVCVIAMPDGEVRYIKEVPVYCVTASFSVFAYVWLLIILQFISPDVCEVWEAVLTLFFMPILLVLAYMADRGYFSPAGKYESQVEERIPEDISDEELKQIELTSKHGMDQGSVKSR